MYAEDQFELPIEEETGKNRYLFFFFLNHASESLFFLSVSQTILSQSHYASQTRGDPTRPIIKKDNERR